MPPPARREAARPAATPQGPSAKPRPSYLPPSYPVLLGALMIIALGWGGVRLFRSGRTAAQPPQPLHALGASLSQAPDSASLAPASLRAPVAAISTAARGQNAATSGSALHQVIPDVPRSARRTIRGHIKVWVRLIVDQDGSVEAAIADLPGPSRYFRRLAIDAAKEWTFQPVDAPAQRLIQVRFDFSRDRTTGHAVALH
jgi:hypothetical protein